ncbi:MAG: tetratricopeptide repeat protein [Chloroflexi bacterium]|nr:tetratricopeptide repeat protein [Chloroflexota bacterium]
MTLTDHRLLRERALAQLTANKPVEAIRLLFRLLESDPTDLDTLLTLGDCYLAANDTPAADVFYQRASQVGLDPSRARLRRNLAAGVAGGPSSPWLIQSGCPVGAQQTQAYLDTLRHAAPTSASSVEPLRSTPALNITRGDARQATLLLEEIMCAPDPSAAMRQRLDDVLHHLPDIIALAASQAEHEGDPRRAQALLILAERAAV